jgi:hypothetical protein
MPMHDWTQVEPTIYHHFHQQWSSEICKALNAGLLPPGVSALLEQHTGGVVPDVLAVERRKSKPKPRPSGGTAVAPRTRWTVEADQAEALRRRANRIAIRHRLGEVVCVIEIVSPGNKASRAALRQFLDKTLEFVRAGVNLLLVDPFPPGPRDPHSLHKLLWDEMAADVPFDMPADEPLLLAAYRVGDPVVGMLSVAYLEAARVGGELPDMPAWLDPDVYVNVPLEASYRAAWQACPADYRYLVEHGRLPDEDVEE